MLVMEVKTMTNVLGTPEKEAIKKQLFRAGIDTLQQRGWTVEKIRGFGKSSVRKITMGGKSRKVSIRTSQDTWIAFPRNHKDSGWVTLDDVELVVAVSVDDRDDPKFAQVHLIEASEMRKRFDRAYAARNKAGHTIPRGRGVWLPLYYPDAADPVSHVGGGAGLDHPPIARVPLVTAKPVVPEKTAWAESFESKNTDSKEEPLTIPEAKRRLALTFGVDPSNIRISVEG